MGKIGCSYRGLSIKHSQKLVNPYKDSEIVVKILLMIGNSAFSSVIT